MKHWPPQSKLLSETALEVVPPIGELGGLIGPTTFRIGAETNVADTVTALFGIVNVHGLLEEPPEHEAPLILQLENFQLVDGVAVTEIDELTCSWQPLGQSGDTEPEPEATFVVRGWVWVSV